MIKYFFKVWGIKTQKRIYDTEEANNNSPNNKKYFINIIFLLIVWKINVMDLNFTHFLVHVCLFPCDPPNRKIKKMKTSPLYVIYIITGAWSNSQWPAPY